MLILFSFFPVVYSSGEFDAITVVSSVTDGDTFDTTSEGTVRLADINASELGQEGYQAAKDYLDSLVYGKTVFLDIDDIYKTDQYDRLVCVVYREYNQTHYLNVNKALLVTGHAELKDYDNEFNPDSWSLYVSKEEIPEFFSLIMLLILIVSTFMIIIIKIKPLKRKKY